MITTSSCPAPSPSPTRSRASSPPWHGALASPRFLILNGHGGNQPALRLAPEQLHAAEPGLAGYGCDYWTLMLDQLDRAKSPTTSTGPEPEATTNSSKPRRHLRIDLDHLHGLRAQVHDAVQPAESDKLVCIRSHPLRKTTAAAQALQDAFDDPGLP
ncbi:hypothetical protein AB0L64_19910 [Kribbella sp. NPDC051936]|uniref:hypothetical protein n=1 Tax=Kribbella sp. NPDC051936 TaxID=3154946 RepID=UPI00341F6C5B